MQQVQAADVSAFTYFIISHKLDLLRTVVSVFFLYKPASGTRQTHRSSFESSPPETAGTRMHAGI